MNRALAIRGTCSDSRSESRKGGLLREAWVDALRASASFFPAARPLRGPLALLLRGSARHETVRLLSSGTCTDPPDACVWERPSQPAGSPTAPPPNRRSAATSEGAPRPTAPKRGGGAKRRARALRARPWRESGGRLCRPQRGNREVPPKKERRPPLRGRPSWSLRPDLNRRPHPYQGCALPTELRRRERAGDEGRTRDIQLGRLTLYQLSYSRGASAEAISIKSERRSSQGLSGWSRIRTYEAKRGGFTVRSLWPARASILGSSSERRQVVFSESWRWDSNPQPPDYKSGALPLSYTSRLPPSSSRSSLERLARTARWARCISP